MTENDWVKIGEMVRAEVRFLSMCVLALVGVFVWMFRDVDSRLEKLEKDK